MNRLDYVDALRGIAVMLVVLVHAGADSISPLFTPITYLGQFGVQLFFLMSAFTLCVTNERSPLNRRTYGSFLVRRFFRIAPMYYLALASYFVLSLLAEHSGGHVPFTSTYEYTVAKVVANLTFLHGFYPDANNSMVPGGWSIGCEFAFYALFPFIFYISRKWQRAFLLIGVLSALGLVSMSIAARMTGHSGEGGNNSFLFYGLANQMPVFLLGILFYHFQASPRLARTSQWLMIPACILLIVSFNWRWGWVVTPLLSGIAFMGLAFWVRVRAPHRWLCRVGELSYSIYLVHFAVAWFLVPSIQQFVNPISPDLAVPLSFIVVLIVSMAIAGLTHRYIEMYFIDLGKHISRRWVERVPNLLANDA